MVRITVLDGAGCIGGNKILLEDGAARLFFDFGTNFSTQGHYYEEFLKPKSCQGIYEPIRMGLLPPFRDLYRPDMITKLCEEHGLWEDVGAKDIGEVGGVLVSHAHVDHIGSIHFLRSDIPVYCSPVTAAVSRALQDAGKGATAAEYCYYTPREYVEGDCEGLRTIRNGEAQTRTFYLTAPPPQEFVEQWQTLPQSRKSLKVEEFKQAELCGGLRVRGFPVDHSVYGASAWAVETSSGWVVYTGDLRVSGKYGDATWRFVEEAAKLKPAVLIIEGTRINAKRGLNEEQVRDSCLEVVRRHKGLIVADFGPRNVERLLVFMDVARETHRSLAVLPADAYLLDMMRKAAGDSGLVPSIDDSVIKVYWEYQSQVESWKKYLREAHPESLFVRPDDVRANQGDFICCFSFWDINELAYIKPVDDSAYVFSSCEAFNEEMAIDARRLRNWINRFGLKLYGRLDQSDQESDPFHVSGHASGPELAEIVEGIRPKVLIPVHSEHPSAYQDLLGNMCRVEIPENGKAIEL
ncbi:MAG: MBL fold metallo-hydrolase RNA specificity domain-containing protein [Armatimonadota bacterium]|nr:MBL fold metallo-hydrolase RNA specificity domain-containing protein [Armatimonadota bacterium]